MQITNETLEALEAASGAKLDEALAGQIQASLDGIASLDQISLKDVEPAIKFSPTDDARTTKS